MKYLKNYEDFKGYHDIADLKTWNTVKTGPVRNVEEKPKRKKNKHIEEEDIKDIKIPYKYTFKGHNGDGSLPTKDIDLSL